MYLAGSTDLATFHLSKKSIFPISLSSLRNSKTQGALLNASRVVRKTVSSSKLLRFESLSHMFKLREFLNIKDDTWLQSQRRSLMNLSYHCWHLKTTVTRSEEWGLMILIHCATPSHLHKTTDSRAIKLSRKCYRWKKWKCSTKSMLKLQLGSALRAQESMLMINLPKIDSSLKKLTTSATLTQVKRARTSSYQSVNGLIS